MGLFDRFKKKEPSTPLDFSQVDSAEKAESLARQGILQPLYLMPPRFGGEESVANRLFAPAAAVALKDRCDDTVEDLLRQGKIQGYSCTPEYREKSFIPCAITVTATKDGTAVFTETIHIW